MTPDVRSASGSIERHAASQTGAQLVRCGAELVELAETYYVRVFAVTMNLLVTLVALMVLTEPLAPGDPTFTLIALGAIGCAGLLARRRPLQNYRALRTHPTAIVAGVGAVGIALAIDDPLNSALWLVAFGPLTVSMLASDGRLTAACACILIAGYVLGIVLHGHLQHFVDSPRLASQAAGYALWGLLLHGTIDGGAVFMLRISQSVSTRPSPPRRVNTWTTPARAPASAQPVATVSAEPVPVDPTINLTARQLEVVALLCDGLMQHQIAQALGISARQVERHVRDAKNRLRAHTTPQLVTIALAAGLVRTHADRPNSHFPPLGDEVSR